MKIANDNGIDETLVDICEVCRYSSRKSQSFHELCQESQDRCWNEKKQSYNYLCINVMRLSAAALSQPLQQIFIHFYLYLMHVLLEKEKKRSSQQKVNFPDGRTVDHVGSSSGVEVHRH